MKEARRRARRPLDRAAPWPGWPGEFGWFSYGSPQEAGWQRTGRLPWQRVYLEPAPAELVLIGPPGVGKTTVAGLLARSGDRVVDTDDVVAQRAGCSVPEIFERHGEDHFRALEAEAVREAVTTSRNAMLPAIVSLGGGAVMTPAVQEVLREHAAAGRMVVWLQVDPDAVAERLGAGDRPLLTGDADVALERWRVLASERHATYADLATLAVDTTGRPAQEVAAIIRQSLLAQRVREATQEDGDQEEPQAVDTASPVSLEDRWPRTARSGLRVSVSTTTGTAAYPVEIGHGVLDALSGLLEATGRVPHRALVVHQPGLEATGERVAKALEEAGTRVHRHRIEAAEAGKSLAGVEGIWAACADAGLDRRDLLVAVGGGAATDVAGFAAATWMRGIDVVHVPTTLLGMVDASVGGKTGINTAAGKNLVGSFHQPRAVVCDLDLLDGLPVEDVRAGLAEVVKCSLIDPDDADGDALQGLLREGVDRGGDPRDWPFLAQLVHHALRVKAHAVAADTRDVGTREFLNYGHTLGHALEKVEGYRLRHGDAVAIGMVYALALGGELGLYDAVDELRELLTGLGLPTRYEGQATWEQVRAAMALDKKAHGGALRFVLLEWYFLPVVLPVDDEDALHRAWEAVAPI